MKIAIDERIKHRLVGLAVILSVAAILLPAILKKSSQPFDTMSRVAVRLPARPLMPRVSVADENRLFKTMKVAKVSLPAPTQLSEAQVSASPKVASLKNPPLPIKEEPIAVVEIPQPSVLPTLPKVAVKSDPTHEAPVAVNTLHTHASPPSSKHIEARTSISHHHVSAPATAGFAVQVANFSSAENAKILLNKLQSKGYPAQMTRHTTSRGVSYKVMVGRGATREDMVRLQKKLYSSMQLNGFVVPVNVG